MTLLIRYHKIRKREREPTAQARHVRLVGNRQKIVTITVLRKPKSLVGVASAA